MLSVDQPMRVGDLVRVDDGGVRRTDWAALDGDSDAGAVAGELPNGKLADMKIECLQARDNLRLHCTLGLTYDATVAQLDGCGKRCAATSRIIRRSGRGCRCGCPSSALASRR